MVNPSFWKDRRVLVTGHTGFKGAWLALWLKQLGANITGYSLDPPTDPSLFDLAGIGGICRDLRADIGDEKKLQQAFAEARPEIVFHLAAQALVRESYRIPRETWKTNVLGTLGVLEACHASPSVRAIVVITTDKVYENPEQGQPFRETDPLGGFDPYSSSKAACEILCSSWRRSFLAGRPQAGIGLATARAGNVIGGGDFAADRLIPDLVRAQISGQVAHLRYPGAVRPWQHVLEPLAGYLQLGENLYRDPIKFAEAYNFGPTEADVRPVGDVADNVCQYLKTQWEQEAAPQPHEANLLLLNIERSKRALAWRPRLRLEEAIRITCEWYGGWLAKADMRALTQKQIQAYQALPPLPEAN